MDTRSLATISVGLCDVQIMHYKLHSKVYKDTVENEREYKEYNIIQRKNSQRVFKDIKI